MNKRIVLVFDYKDMNEDEKMTQDFLEDVAKDLNSQMGHYEGYEGWRVEDDGSTDHTDV